MTDLHGVIPYLVSPIDTNGKVMRDVLSKLCIDLIDAGVHGLTPLGSTGEFAYLSWEQKCDVVETVVAAANKKVPVIAGVSSTTIADAILQTKKWESLGCDGILAVIDSYFPLSEEAVYSYFAAIAAATALPIVIYTNPNFQRTDLSIPLIARLAAIENIRCIKDASSNTGRLLSIMNACGDAISVFAASAHIPACVMLLGGKGWMAGPACVAPRQSIELYTLCREGKWAEAMEKQRVLWQLNQAFAKYSLAACIKTCLEIQGYPVGAPLAPQEPLNSAAIAHLRDVLTNIGAT